jgi:hypothetical protein
MEAIRSNNLSNAWLKAARRLLELPGYETFDLVVEIEGPLDEDEWVRRPLDQYLAATKKQSIETVASTIFPERLWRPPMGGIICTRVTNDCSISCVAFQGTTMVCTSNG